MSSIGETLPDFEFDLDALTPVVIEEDATQRRQRQAGRRSSDTTTLHRPEPQDLSPIIQVSPGSEHHLVDFRYVARELEKGSLSPHWQRRFWDFLPWAKKGGPVSVNFDAVNVGPLNQAMFPTGRPAQIVFGQMQGGVGTSTHSISLAAAAALAGRQAELVVLYLEATQTSDMDIRLAMSEATTQRELLEGWQQGMGEREHLENSALREPQTGLRMLFAPHDSRKHLDLEEMIQVHTVARRASNLLIIDTDPGDPLEDSPKGELLRHFLLSAHAVVVPARGEYAGIVDAARYIRNCQEIGVPSARIWFLLTGGLLDQRNLSPTLWKYISPSHFFKIPDAHVTVERALLSFKIPGLETQELYNSYRELLKRLLAGCRAEMASPSGKTSSQFTRLRSSRGGKTK
jgi:MinD-like ATPase involved in chromosome partitioning or flagellar assembly